MNDNDLVLAIRKAGMSQPDEAALIVLVEKYGQRKWADGYREGIEVANSDRP